MPPHPLETPQWDDARQRRPPEVRLLLSPARSERIARRSIDEWSSSRAKAPGLVATASVPAGKGHSGMPVFWLNMCHREVHRGLPNDVLADTRAYESTTPDRGS